MTETNTVTYPDSPQPPKRGRGPLLALAVAAAVLLVGVLGLLAANRNEVEPAQIVPTTEAVPTTGAAPDYSAARETLDTWAVAIGAGDVDAAMATHSFDPDDLASSREAMAYLGATVSHAEFNDCEFTTLSTSGRNQARCDLTLIDPILVASEVDTVGVSWQLSDDGQTIVVSEPGNRLTAKNLFVPYAQEHYPDEFAEACGSDTVNYNGFTGWAFNRACGEFTAELADEVVDAIQNAG
jgi:hypothetical protein